MYPSVQISVQWHVSYHGLKTVSLIADGQMGIYHTRRDLSGFVFSFGYRLDFSCLGFAPRSLKEKVDEWPNLLWRRLRSFRQTRNFCKGKEKSALFLNPDLLTWPHIPFNLVYGSLMSRRNSLILLWSLSKQIQVDRWDPFWALTLKSFISK